MDINKMTIEELYAIKGRIITDLDIIQNDLNIINKKIIELRQNEQMIGKEKIMDIKKN